MSQIRKHTFEAVSLLTAENGTLEVTVIPAMNQPDWLVPTDLILSVDDYDERIWTYLWQDQEVAVFHLLPRGETPDKLVVLEGNTTVHRLALQTVGELQNMQVRISEVRDAELPEEYVDTALHNKEDNLEKSKKFNIYQQVGSDSKNNNTDAVEEDLRENVVLSYLFQAVTIDDTFYMIPDLDLIAHKMVDLDS